MPCYSCKAAKDFRNSMCSFRLSHTNELRIGWIHTSVIRIRLSFLLRYSFIHTNAFHARKSFPRHFTSFSLFSMSSHPILSNFQTTRLVSTRDFRVFCFEWLRMKLKESKTLHSIFRSKSNDFNFTTFATVDEFAEARSKRAGKKIKAEILHCV